MERDTENNTIRERRKYRFLRNKYFVTAFLFIIWVAFFDENNLVERFQNMREMHKLKEEKAYYHEMIKEDATRLKELKTNNDNLEKFAREQYLMKKDDEDVFVIVKK